MRRGERRIKLDGFLEVSYGGRLFTGSGKQKAEPVFGGGCDRLCLFRLRERFERASTVTGPQKIFGSCLPVGGSIRLYGWALYY